MPVDNTTALAVGRLRTAYADATAHLVEAINQVDAELGTYHGRAGGYDLAVTDRSGWLTTVDALGRMLFAAEQALLELDRGPAELDESGSVDLDAMRRALEAN